MQTTRHPKLSLKAWIDAVTATGALVGLFSKANFGRQRIILPPNNPGISRIHLFLYIFTWNHAKTMNKILRLCNRSILTSRGKSMLPTLKEENILWSRLFPKDICLGDVVSAMNPRDPSSSTGVVKRVMGIEGQSFTKKMYRERVVVWINHYDLKVVSH